METHPLIALNARLWRDKYLPRAAAEREAEETRRCEDFLDVPRTVAGHELRPLALRDIVQLDASGSALGTSRACYATPVEVMAFLWYQRAAAPSWFPRRAFARFQALHRRRYAGPKGAVTDAFLADLAAVVTFIGEAFADAGGSSALDAAGQPVARPRRHVYFVADLLVSLGAEAGDRDRFSGRLYSEVPIGRLWQYRRALARRAGDKSFTPSAEAYLRNECAAEAQALWDLSSKASATEDAQLAASLDPKPVSPPVPPPPAPDRANPKS